MQARQQENKLAFWNLSTRQVFAESVTNLEVPLLGFSPDGQWMFTVSGLVVKVWNLKTGHELKMARARGWLRGTNSSGEIVVDSKGRQVAWTTDRGFVVQDLDSAGTRYKSIIPYCDAPPKPSSVCSTDDADLTLLSFIDGDNSLLFQERIATRDISWKFPKETVFSEVNVLSHSAVERKSVPTNGRVRASFDSQNGILIIGESPNVAELNRTRQKPPSLAYRELRLIDWRTGRDLRHLRLETLSDEEIRSKVVQTLVDNPEGTSNSVRFSVARSARDIQSSSDIIVSPDGRRVAAALTFDGVALWDEARQSPIYQTGAAPFVLGMPGTQPTSITFSNDSQLLAIGWGNGDLEMLQAETGKVLRRWSTGDAKITAMSFYPGSHLLLSGQNDGTVKIWNCETGELLLTMIVGTQDDDWAVLSAAGTFDGDTAGWERFVWQFNDSMLDTLPVEAYFRQAFRPGLLRDQFGRHCTEKSEFGCEVIEPKLSVSEIDRSQPLISIKSVMETDPAHVSVELSVHEDHQGPVEGFTYRGKGGIYDVRLFRDGQLVAEEPRADVYVPPGKDDGQIETALGKWRTARQVNLNSSGNATITLSDVRVPRRSDVNQVEFTAYAFNADRVKSFDDFSVQIHVTVEARSFASGTQGLSDHNGSKCKSII